MSGHDHNHKHESIKNIRFAFFINLIFTVIEIVGGVLTNSMAILSDALHDFGDSLSLGLAWYFQQLSGKGSDTKFTYGYARFSILGALINGFIILFGSIFIVVETVERVLHPEEVEAGGMILLAILGIIFNGLAALRLKKGSSINEEVVSIHLLEDVFGWVAVLITSIVMYFNDLPILDPILTIAILSWIVFNVFKNLRKSIKILMQGTPENIQPAAIAKIIRNHPKVREIADLHIWSLDGDYNVLSLDLVVNNELPLKSLTQIKKDIKLALKDFDLQHFTIEFTSDTEPLGHEHQLFNK